MEIWFASTHFYDVFHEGNAFALQSALTWGMNSYGKADRKKWPTVKEVAAAAQAIPAIDADIRGVSQPIAFYRDWALHDSKDSFWQSVDGDETITRVRAPALLIAGWFDPFLTTQLKDFETLRNSAHEDVAQGTRLIIGPWGHARSVDLPDEAKCPNFREVSISESLPWFDKFSQGRSATDVSVGRQSPVKLFVMGENKWRSENEWPLARAKYIDLYAISNGRANTAHGDGELRLENCSMTRVDCFTYDPFNPVPTAGGAVIGRGSGTYAQNTSEERNDVL